MYSVDTLGTRQNSYQAQFQYQNNTRLQNLNGYCDNKLDSKQHILLQPQADLNQNILAITEQDSSKKNIDTIQDMCNNNKQNVTNVLTVLNTSAPDISNKS